ncbi:MAG: LysR family transcriptional regulator [Actinobacteria bacterium HGW-Actinobacteria-7]|jgi:DNA-binding transcriptional LysR family regulator|nr:MAG: LysR family transcriptional regulator [Actinobacteria bacterium HGW-Actinobacteria-7]
MNTLNTARLRILREVAARGTITAAAEALYLTPPAVSHQLATLEREVGIPLLQRSARSIRLTGAGQVMVAHAETILADCETALAAVAAFAEEISGTVRISVFQTAAQSIALPALSGLAHRYPALEITIRELEPVRAIPALRAGQLDIALSHEWDFVPRQPDPSITRFNLLAEPIVAILPRDHPLASGPVRLRDLAQEHWCVAGPDAMSRKAVERVAQSAGFQPKIILESNYFRALGSAVEAGLGVGIAPAMTDMRGLDIVMQPLIEPSMERRIFAAVRAGSGESPTIRTVLDAMIEAARTPALQ